MTTTRFLNVDLEVRCDSELDKILTGFESRAMILHQQDGHAVLELLEQPATIDAALINFCDVVASFDPAAKSSWDRCNRRCFNIGIQAGKDYQSEFVISDECVAAVAEISANFILTVYGEDR